MRPCSDAGIFQRDDVLNRAEGGVAGHLVWTNTAPEPARVVPATRALATNVLRCMAPLLSSLTSTSSNTDPHHDSVNRSTNARTMACWPASAG